MSKPLIVKTAVGATSATLIFDDIRYPCVIGRSGAIAQEQKKEGDGATPLGEYRILRGFYRADRIEKPSTNGLEMLAIKPDMGWEDSADAKNYNTFIARGYDMKKEESFWREDPLYNIILVMDHNGAWPFETPRSSDDGAEAGKGSAIFMHVMKHDEQGVAKPTAGCVAFEQEDLITILGQLEANHPIKIQ